MPLNLVQKLGIAGSGVLFFVILYQTAIFPAVVKKIVTRKVALKQGWMMRDIWGKFPFTMDYSIYMFNISNPDEIKNGAKPIVNQVGPYIYDEYQEKVNQQDNEEDDTITFNFKSTFYFNQEKSGSLTGDEELTVPNYFALAIVNLVLRDKPSAIPIVAKAVDSIMRKPTSLFMKAKVKDILWNGLFYDCTVKDFAGSAVCNELKLQYEEFGMVMVAENQYMHSLLGSRNGTEAKGKTRVYRGLKHLMDVGKVIEYNHKNNISLWDDDYCDTFNGTDGTIFHPFFDKKGREDVVVFNQDLCRAISLQFDSYAKLFGLKLLRYTTDLGTDGNNNPLHKCFCPTPDTCLRKGVYDAYKCVKLPLIVSNPHFYLADPYYLEQVEGLNPVKEDHMLLVDLDPFVGLPMHAHTRAQFNMFIMKLDKFKLMKNFPEALLPLFWIDERLYLPDFLVKEIKDGHKLYTMGKIFEYFLTVTGLGLSGFAGFKFYKLRQEGKTATTKTTKPKNEANNNGEKKSPISTLHPAPVPPNVD